MIMKLGNQTVTPVMGGGGSGLVCHITTVDVNTVLDYNWQEIRAAAERGPVIAISISTTGSDELMQYQLYFVGSNGVDSYQVNFTNPYDSLIFSASTATGILTASGK